MARLTVDLESARSLEMVEREGQLFPCGAARCPHRFVPVYAMNPSSHSVRGGCLREDFAVASRTGISSKGSLSHLSSAFGYCRAIAAASFSRPAYCILRAECYGSSNCFPKRIPHFKNRPNLVFIGCIPVFMVINWPLGILFSSSGVINRRPIICRLRELLSLPLLTEPERTVCSPRSLERVSAVSLPGAKPPKMVSWQLSRITCAPSLP